MRVPWTARTEEEDKKKDHEKILEEIIVENFPKMGKEIITQVQETQRVPNRIKLKAKHPKTHINQINKDQTQRTNIKSSKGKTTNIIFLSREGRDLGVAFQAPPGSHTFACLPQSLHPKSKIGSNNIYRRSDN